MVDLRQEQARQLAEPRSCWETLAQPFEPDLTLARLQELLHRCVAVFPLCWTRFQVVPALPRSAGI